MSKKNLAAVVAVLILVPVVTFGSSFFNVDDFGNVSIGSSTSTPNSKLFVAGTTTATCFSIDGSTCILGGSSAFVAASSTSIDWSKGSNQSLTISSPATFTFSNAQSGGEYKLLVKQDTTGARTASWPSSVLWSEGVSPDLALTASSSDIMSFTYNGSQYLGSHDADFSIWPPSLFSSIVAYWKFDATSGNAADATGNGHTLTNANAFYGRGIVGNGAYLNIGGAQFSTSAVTDFNFERNEDFSISGWFKLTADNSNQAVFSHQESSGDNRGYALYTGGSGKLIFVLGNDAAGTNMIYVRSANVFSIGEWNHVLVTYDGSSAASGVTMYVNGASVPLTALFDGLTATTQTSVDVVLGNRAGTSVNFAGALDEVGVWDRDLTSTEATQLYNLGRALHYPL